jgi:hypothetical protein
VEWEEGSGRVGRVGLCLVRREVGVRGAAVVIRLAEKYEDGEEMSWSSRCVCLDRHDL